MRRTQEPSAEEAKRSAKRATFTDVTPAERRQPSWIVRARNKEAPSVTPAPRPPRLPREFVAAFERELDHHSRAPDPPERHSTPPPPRPAAEPSPDLLSAAPPRPDPELMAALAAAVESLARARGEVLTETAAELAELAATIARRVLAKELSLDPTIIHGLVREGLEALGEHDRVVVRLGSAFAPVADAVVERLARTGTKAEVRVVPELGPHGCVVETELGVVDESVEARLAALLQALKPESAPPG